MKICVITSAHPVFDKRIFNREIRSLKKFGHEISYLAPTKTQYQIVDGVKIWGIPVRSKFARFLNWLVVFRLAIQERYDCFHIQDPDLLLVAILIKIFTKKPVVYDVHENYGDRVLRKAKIPNIIKDSMGFIVNIIEYICVKVIKNVIVAHDFQVQRFKKIGCNTLLLENFAKLENFPQEKVRKNYSDKIVVFTGELIAIRGAEILAKVISALVSRRSDIQFNIIDFIRNKKDRQEWEKLIHKYNIANKFKTIPMVAPDCMADIVSMGVIGLIVEPHTGQLRKNPFIPTRLYEYFACGLAVITREHEGFKDIIQKNGCGIVLSDNDMDNASKFTENIIYLIDHPNIVAEMGQKGRQLFVSKYNWELQEPSFKEYYRKLFN